MNLVLTPAVVLRGTTECRLARMAADCALIKASVGYVAASDGWTDLHQHKSLEWEFDAAPDGNVALICEVSLAESQEFTLGVAFGMTRHHALATLLQSLSIHFDDHRKTFVEQWTRAAKKRRTSRSTIGRWRRFVPQKCPGTSHA